MPRRNNKPRTDNPKWLGNKKNWGKLGLGQKINVGKTDFDLHQKQAAGRLWQFSAKELGQTND